MCAQQDTWRDFGVNWSTLGSFGLLFHEVFAGTDRLVYLQMLFTLFILHCVTVTSYTEVSESVEWLLLGDRSNL